MVGRIQNHYNAGYVNRGQEKDFFEFGGSTIILLTQANKVNVEKQILKNSINNTETEVKTGSIIATANIEK